MCHLAVHAEDSLANDLITPRYGVASFLCQISSSDRLYITKWWGRRMEGHIDLAQTRYLSRLIFSNMVSDNSFFFFQSGREEKQAIHILALVCVFVFMKLPAVSIGAAAQSSSEELREDVGTQARGEVSIGSFLVTQTSRWLLGSSRREEAWKDGEGIATSKAAITGSWWGRGQKHPRYFSRELVCVTPTRHRT